MYDDNSSRKRMFELLSDQIKQFDSSSACFQCCNNLFVSGGLKNPSSFYNINSFGHFISMHEELPSPVSCHSMTGNQQRIIVSGGVYGKNKQTFKSVWQYSLSQSEWLCLPSLPNGVFQHTSLLAQNGVLFIFGGYQNGIKRSNKIECLKNFATKWENFEVRHDKSMNLGLNIAPYQINEQFILIFEGRYCHHLNLFNHVIKTSSFNQEDDKSLNIQPNKFTTFRKSGNDILLFSDRVGDQIKGGVFRYTSNGVMIEVDKL